MPHTADKFFTRHVFFPLLALLLFSTLNFIFDLDHSFASFLYAIEGHTWALRENWLTAIFFHKGGKYLSVALGLLTLFFLVIACRNKDIHALNRKFLLYLAIAAAGNVTIINCLKSMLAISCPWEFDQFGGSLSYIPLFKQFMLRNGAGCFPAGQASSGYAWIALYFFAVCYQSRWKKMGLILPIVTGLILGFAQQLRGAHFISHDIFTLAICWFFSLSLYLYMFKPSAMTIWPNFKLRNAGSVIYLKNNV